MPIKHLHESVTKRPKDPKKKDARDWKSIAVTLGIAAAAALLVGFFILTLVLAWMSRDLPNPNALLNREVAQSTKIFDRTGEVLLYEIHGDEQRTLITINDIPDVMKQATVAIEDKDFYKHRGVSWKGLVRAFASSILQRKRVGGTSTLTQQVVKNAILTTERSINRKLKEILLSLQIERKYSKDQILQLYLNEIPYGSTLYGVESAAQGYFGKSVREITLDEAALLAAMPQSPDTYNPYGTGSRGDNRELLVGRQHYIIDQMVEQGYITQEAGNAAKEVDTLEKLIPRTVGNIKAPHFVMMVRAELVERLGQRTVETGGLKVITTLDWNMQQEAEKAVAEGVEARGERYGFSNASLVSIGPRDGHVLAMVGSKDFFDETIDGQVNVALTPQQPGSSFKPIVYTAGFMKGYTPETTLWDVKTAFRTDSGTFSPNNYDFSEHGPVSVRMALQGSLNIPAVKMLYLVGVGRALDLAEELGYTTLGERSRFGLSLVLGGGDVKLLEHAAAFGVFATEGVKYDTASILRVEGPNGDLLEEWKLGEGKRVFNEQTARITNNVLSDNNARAYVFGTQNTLTLPGRPVAAKTGTTNDFRDAWTVGYTPSLVTGVWVGNTDNVEMSRGADGSIIAAPIWNAFMRAVTAGTPVESFTPPTPPNTTKDVLLGKAFKAEVKIDSVSGKLATEYTPPELVKEETFYEAHSILHYVDKDNPTGPVPSNPARDPQYANWESAVQAWVEKEGWNATSTPPTEYDDVHTKDSIPSVRIISPSERQRIESRSFQIETSVSSERDIQSVQALVNGYVVGSAFRAQGDRSWVIDAVIPNALGKGFHDLQVVATDDVGNKSSETVSINMLAEAQELLLQVIEPAPGSEITLDAFPKSVEVQINDLSSVVRADLFLETPTGDVELIGSGIQPDESPIVYNWSFIRGPGTYSLYTEVTTSNGGKIRGDKISVVVKPAKPQEEEEDEEN